ncbi:hypothetical protein ABT127_21590 [Streptomyces sp. NPDC001904]|uniref:hypothetical protein n=1 Tax=Streptomyces sp. NPDC001904 TaxID=3154531 RepID=UPI0033202F37
MGRISVPVQDLKDTARELQNIADLIGNSATLHHASGDRSDFKSVAGGGDLVVAAGLQLGTEAEGSGLPPGEVARAVPDPCRGHHPSPCSGSVVSSGLGVAGSALSAPFPESWPRTRWTTTNARAAAERFSVHTPGDTGVSHPTRLRE